MKLTTLSTLYAATFAQDAEPRLPIDRLNTLNQFVHDWITENIEKRAKRPQRAYHMGEVFDRIYDKQADAYDRCGQFDPSLPQGGPPERYAEFGQRRKRRSDEEHDAFDYFERQLQSDETRTDALLILEQRLALDPNTALREIQTGYRKWITRYLVTCRTERENSEHRNLLLDIADNVRRAFTELRELSRT